MPALGLGLQTGPGGECLLFREAVPGDEPVAHTEFHRLSEETRHNRFMAAVNEIPEGILRELRHPEPSRVLFLACFRLDGEGREVEAVGAARLVHDAEGAGGDFGMVLADAWQRRGIGARLLRILIDNARARGLKRLRGHVLATNEAMLGLARRLGFRVTDSDEEGRRVKIVTLELEPAS
jgi:RimJ/RimL family protein N-acetyltransferase